MVFFFFLNMVLLLVCWSGGGAGIHKGGSVFIVLLFGGEREIVKKEYLNKVAKNIEFRNVGTWAALLYAQGVQLNPLT